jgi:hypothetical protein
MGTDILGTSTYTVIFTIQTLLISLHTQSNTYNTNILDKSTTYQGCLYCKCYYVCRLTKDVCIVSIAVYVDLPRMFVLSLLLCMSQYKHLWEVYLHRNTYNTHILDKSIYTVILTIQTHLVCIVSITVYVDYKGCLYCKYYCVCRLPNSVCIVSITVYVDLPSL